MVDATLSMVADPRREVELHRLVHDRVSRVLAEHGSPDFAPDVDLDAEGLQHRVEGYEHLAADLATVAGASGYWSPEDQAGLWVSVIERLAGMRTASGRTAWLDLARYPALLVLYAVSIGAVARRRYGTLRAVLKLPIITDVGRAEAVTDVLYPPSVLDVRLARQLSGLARRQTPFNDRVHETLRPWLAMPVPDDHAYERAFEEFEYLFGLVALAVSKRDWGPPGAVRLEAQRRS